MVDDLLDASHRVLEDVHRDGIGLRLDLLEEGGALRLVFCGFSG